MSKKILFFIFILFVFSCGINSDKNIIPEQNTSETIKEKEGVYYEIFVRSYADSNGDGIGDFKGLTDKLDYLNDNNPETKTDLGINGIWLMPITVSPSYHKYDVVDYYNIDPEYGTMEDFERFIEEAHKRGIKVIMDLVVNHTSSKNPWFQEAIKDKKSKYRDYYRFTNEKNKNIDLNVTEMGHKSWNKISDGDYYFALFWDQMPDLNLDNREVREEIKSISKFWLEKGVDGFRLDAAAHIYHENEYNKNIDTLDKNIKWWNEFKEYTQTINPNVYLVGEVWKNSDEVSKYFTALDSNFNFDFAEQGIVKVVSNGSDNVNFSEKLKSVYDNYSKTTEYYLDAPFITNHDQNRSIDQFLNDTYKAKLASNILLTLPGNPFIYYGEEIGMKGSKPDEEIREPFIWGDKYTTTWEPIKNNELTIPVNRQLEDKNSILNHYIKMIDIRNSNDILRYGDFKVYENENSRQVISYIRSYNGKSLLILHNISGKEVDLEIDKINSSNDSYVYGSETNKYKNGILKLQPRSTSIMYIN